MMRRPSRQCVWLTGAPGALRAAEGAVAAYQAATELVPVVVVARQEDDARLARLGRVGEDAGEIVVTRALAGVREVAGQQEDIGPQARRRGLAQRGQQVVPGPRAVRADPAGGQVNVRQLHKQVGPHGNDAIGRRGRQARP